MQAEEVEEEDADVEVEARAELHAEAILHPYSPSTVGPTAYVVILGQNAHHQEKATNHWQQWKTRWEAAPVT